MCGELEGMVVGGVLVTNNELVKATPSKEVVGGLSLPHQNGGARIWLIPPTIGGRPCSFKECQ